MKRQFVRLIDPKRRGAQHTMRGQVGGTSVNQEAEGVRGNTGKSFYYGFHGEEWARHSSPGLGAGLGLASI